MRMTLHSVLLCSFAFAAACRPPADDSQALSSGLPDPSKINKIVLNCHHYLPTAADGTSAMVHFAASLDPTKTKLSTWRVKISRGKTTVDSYEPILDDGLAIRGVMSAEKVELEGQGFSLKLTDVGQPPQAGSAVRRGALGDFKVADGREWKGMSCFYEPIQLAVQPPQQPQPPQTRPTEVATEPVVVPGQAQDIY